MKNFKVNDIVYDNELKGVPIYDNTGRKYICTGICKIEEIYYNDEDTNVLTCYAANSEYGNIAVLAKPMYYKDKIDNDSFSKYNINEQLSKAMEEMINRYEQLPSISCEMIKSEVLEYCTKVEKNINTLITIKRCIECK